MAPRSLFPGLRALPPYGAPLLPLHQAGPAPNPAVHLTDSSYEVQTLEGLKAYSSSKMCLILRVQMIQTKPLCLILPTFSFHIDSLHFTEGLI